MPSRNENAGARDTRLSITNNGVSATGRARVAEIQRARIVSAMVEIASEQGFAGATVARIVARAGVSRRTFYELFADREDCFLAGLDGGIAQASRYVLAGYDPEAKWTERVRTVLTALLVLFDVEPDIGQLLVVGSLGAGHRALECRQRGIAQIIALVDEGGTVSKAGSQLPPLTAEGIVGGALSIIHARLLTRLPPVIGDARIEQPRSGLLVELVNPLMSMIVLPYLGSAAARKELEVPLPNARSRVEPAGLDPLRDLEMRLTYRTVCVLMSVASQPGASNREVGDAAGIGDQGQISKLLSRLERLRLVDNSGLAPGKGAPNAWVLTEKGAQVERAMSANGSRGVMSSSRSR
ncbi:MAG TPA: TetR/AcrR family transcriptional regulator [Solirubrobacteraceae bacterium]